MAQSPYEPSNGRDVIVTTDEGRVTNTREQPSGKGTGLRRLSQPAGLSVTEENNVMTISSGRFLNGGDVDIQVPAKTNLKLNTVNGDDILVERIEGDIEVTSLNGQITLTDVAGAVVAHATNGDVKVMLRQVTAQKPMSFTSFNGDVDVMLPPNVKANLKMRTDHGEVLTDFDVQIQQQRPTSSPAAVFVAPPLPPLPPLPRSPRCHRFRPAPVRANGRRVSASGRRASASARRKSANVRRVSVNGRRATGGVPRASNWTLPSTEPSTAAGPSSNCAHSTETSTSAKASNGYSAEPSAASQRLVLMRATLVHASNKLYHGGHRYERRPTPDHIRNRECRVVTVNSVVPLLFRWSCTRISFA